MSARPRLLVLNQYYSGLEATGKLLAELCEALADAYDVTVVTGAAGDERSVTRTRRNGVDIVRVPSTSFDRRRLALRGLNYVTYIVLATWLAATARARPDVVLAMTDPPFAGDAAYLAARRHGAPLVVVSQDVFPEIAVELGRLENPALVGLLRALVGFYVRRADRLVAIGATMAARLEAKGAEPSRLTVIPNWVDTDAISPAPRDNEWARRNKLGPSRFVVMHSGNVGHAQDLDSLVRAATFLRDLDDLSVVVIGTGARHHELVALARTLEVPVRFLPFQPREILPQSLSAADVHVVGLARGLAGYVVPSRFYGVLAAGRPVIVAADDDSETARIVRETGCGVVVPPGRPELLARAIRAARDGELDLAGMGRRGREWVAANADRGVAIERYRTLLDELRAAT